MYLNLQLGAVIRIVNMKLIIMQNLIMEFIINLYIVPKIRRMLMVPEETSNKCHVTHLFKISKKKKMPSKEIFKDLKKWVVRRKKMMMMIKNRRMMVTWRHLHLIML